MHNVKWLVLSALVVGTTACTAGYQRPYGYNYNSGYYNNSAPRWGYRDSDRDGIPNRYDRDANGNGVPDRFDRR